MERCDSLTLPHISGLCKQEIARRFAAAGIPVFPCRVGSKKPATAHGFKDATTNIGQIDAWWGEADYNVAFEPERAGWCVVDIDDLESWERIDEEKPDTYTVETPSGGRHLYYRGSLPGSASKLAPGVDTRGRGSYVLAPGSVVDDIPYIVSNECDPAPLPAWIAEAVGQQRERITTPVDTDLDLPINVETARARLRDLVRAGDVACEGEGGNDRTYRLAAELINIGLSTEGTADLIEAEWNSHCEPPWPYDELRAIVENAWRYRQNEPGSWGQSESTPEAWREYAKAQPVEAPKPSRFRLVNPSAAMERKPPIYWDAHKLLLRSQGSVSLCFAAFSNFKTTWAANYSVAVARATGCRVLYVLGEGIGGFGPLTLKALVASWNQDHPGDPITSEWLDAHLQLVEHMPHLLDDAQMIEFAGAVGGWKPGLVWLDTLGNATAGANLSAIEVGTKVGQQARYLAEALQADVWLMHHRGKDGDRATGSQYIAGNDPDMILALAHDKDKARLAVTVDKDRWGERGRKVHFGTRLVDLDGRYFVATHELAEDQQPEQEQQAAETQLDQDARRLTLHIAERCAAGVDVGVHNGHEYGPAQLAHDLGLEQPYVKRLLTLARAKDYLKIDKSRGWRPGSVLPMMAAGY